MRKDITGLVDTLKASVIEIAASSPENREALLIKSFSEFQGSLERGLDVRYGPDPEVLEKGLNHISSFASALNRANQVVEAIKTGRPSYMLDGDSNTPPEQLPEETIDELDHWITVGVLALRSMVNNSVELPADEADLERAERAGQLVKIETDAGEIFAKTSLPETLRKFLTDPLELMLDTADLSRAFLDRAAGLAEELLEQEAIPADVIEAYPDLFDVQDPLGKAFPPRKKPTEATPASGGRVPKPGDDGQTSSDANGQDEAIGEGATDEGQGDETTDVTDDTPQDPLQMCTRLATMIVVILGSLQQGAEQGDNDGSENTIAGNPDDPNNVGLQRGEPIADRPLAKILGAQYEVDPSIASLTPMALVEELAKLRGEAPALRKQAKDAGDALALLQKTVEQLRGRPAPGKGVLRALPISKREDATQGGEDPLAKVADQVETLRKQNPEGDSAARLLIAAVHQRGGQSIIPGG